MISAWYHAYFWDSRSGFLTPSGTAATVGHVPWGPEQDTVNGLSSTPQGQGQGFPQAAQWVMTPSTKQEIKEMWAQSLEQEDHLEKKMATHSSVLAWRIPWTEESGRLQSMGSQESGTTSRLNHHHHQLTMKNDNYKTELTLFQLYTGRKVTWDWIGHFRTGIVTERELTYLELHENLALGFARSKWPIKLMLLVD